MKKSSMTSNWEDIDGSITILVSERDPGHDKPDKAIAPLDAENVSPVDNMWDLGSINMRPILAIFSASQPPASLITTPVHPSNCAYSHVHENHPRSFSCCICPRHSRASAATPR